MQKSFSDLEYAAKKKLTRRDRFLAEIDSVTPWGKLYKTVEPFYPKVEGAGRPPIGLAPMLRMYVAQQCFGLSDGGIEDAIYYSQSIRAFLGIDLGRESAPDATTLLKFRHLLEANGLTRQIFDTINGHLAEKGLMMREGAIVDATLIAASTSTKNKDGKRDPERYQSKKGNDWHFGMKAHVGVHVASGLVHTVIGMAGNVADVTQAHALLHGDETAALGDAGYQGVEKRPENIGKSVTWQVAMKRSKRKALPNNKLGRLPEKLGHLKASVRAKVEHPFHVIKNLFRHRNTRYRGLAKNTAQRFTLFAFANLVLAGRRFTITESRSPS
ncbi:IS5 family transposase [Janthinobacterium sp. PSPC3-1]|uniref:IS5 family transposase n=1 Tax=Janthinobacterium sp. PSPC3-1 TaxID=2804653 RepID=UPI003CFA7F10